MGIQLPAELVDVAAKAGVTWPEADEDAMRTAATAWRDAGNRITGLAGDSDGSATKALTGVSGTTGDAARKHWNGVVAPDGELNTAAKGCHAAADRLEHGADQIGAAKVELVRELVNLAKNTDAANSAAACGHPTALLGLDTAIAGTSANVANLANTLAASVRLDSGVDVGATTPPVNANPGSHGHGGGLLDTVAAVVTPGQQSPGGLLDPVTGGGGAHGQGPGLLDAVTGGGGAHGQGPGLLDPVTGGGGPHGQGPGLLDPLTGGGDHGSNGQGKGVLDTVGTVVDKTVGAVTAPVANVVPEAVEALPAPAPHVVAPAVGFTPPPSAEPTFAVAPPESVPSAPAVGFTPPPVDVQPLVNTTDGTVAQSSATLIERPLLPTEVAAQPQAPAQQAPAQAPTQAPGFGPAAPATPAAPSAAVPPAAAPAASPASGAVVGGGQRADQPVGQRLADQTTGQRPTDQAGQRSADQRTPDQAAAQQRTDQKSAGAPQSQSTAQPSTPAPTGKEAKKPEDAAGADVVGFFYFRAFPSGTNPQPSTRPIRQVDASAVEVDHVDGLRFPPQDHPHADLVRTTTSLPHRAPVALGPDHLLVRALTDGYDPQAGLHEREWDARFERTADPLDHVWPPANVFPEGGYEAGRPDVLPAGTEVDRFGTPEGRVLSAAGTKFAARSLPPVDLAAGYRRYVTTQPLPVWRTISAGWFGQPGGGTRYRTTYPVADLVALGYLMELS
jgi:nicrotizing toxin Mtb-like protein